MHYHYLKSNDKKLSLFVTFFVQDETSLLTDFDEIRVIRHIFARNERIWQKNKYRFAR